MSAYFTDGEVRGLARCNQYSGRYEITGGSGNLIRISGLAVTEMFCAEPEGLIVQEAFFLEVMTDAQRLTLTPGRLNIFRSDGGSFTLEVSDCGKGECKGIRSINY
jgi:heat shock protein HslJ